MNILLNYQYMLYYLIESPGHSKCSYIIYDYNIIQILLKR